MISNNCGFIKVSKMFQHNNGLIKVLTSVIMDLKKCQTKVYYKNLEFNKLLKLYSNICGFRNVAKMYSNI